MKTQYQFKTKRELKIGVELNRFGELIVMKKNYGLSKQLIKDLVPEYNAKTKKTIKRSRERVLYRLIEIIKNKNGVSINPIFKSFNEEEVKHMYSKLFK